LTISAESEGREIVTEQELREMALTNKIRIDVARGMLEKVETNPTSLAG